MASVGEMLNGAIGNIAKAMLEIHNSEVQLDRDRDKPAQKAANMLLGKLAPENEARHFITVQYNPSTLSIHATANNVEFAGVQKSKGNGVINQNVRPPEVLLDVELYFDEMLAADAFMFEKMNLSPGSVVSDAAWAVKTAKGNTYTVQPQTHGILATLMRKETRLVTFWWADQRFTGQIVGVQATYTMFSVSGRPIRSKVQLRISQQVELGKDLQYWNNRINQMFKEGGSSGKGLAQNAGNLLNLNNF